MGCMMAEGTSAAVEGGATVISCDASAVSVNGQLIVRLPDAASAALPSRGQVAVAGTIDGDAFQTVVEPDGRRGHWIKIDGRLPVDVAAGQLVTLTFAPVGEWPEPDVPDDLRSALDEAPDIADLWMSVTPMSRWEWVRWIGSTKNAATRAKRVDVAISKMSSGQRRPCCFDRASCTDPELAKSGKLVIPDEI